MLEKEELKDNPATETATHPFTPSLSKDASLASYLNICKCLCIEDIL